MKRFTALPIFILVLLLSPPPIIAGGFHGKPSAPIRVEAKFINGGMYAGIGKIEVRVTPLTEADQVIVTAEASEGITIIQGEREWRGKIESGKTGTFRYTIECGNNSYEKITFRASIERRNFKVSASAAIEINKELKKEKTLEIRIKKRGKGDSVIEMKGD